jgi:GT2 family glycosyltransferase
MYEELKQLIGEAKWDAAEKKAESLETEGKWDSEYSVLRATICEAEGKRTGELQAIARGIAADWRNYELFYMLGLMYQNLNINQAYLCMRQAEWYCAYGGESAEDWCNDLCHRAEMMNMNKERLQDLIEIRRMRAEMEKRTDLSVRGLSIMILSYEDQELMEECLTAIRHYHDLRDTQIVVVDNASTDGTAEWLRMQDGIELIENGDNVGFPTGCNIGIKACNPENDLFLLNNDAILTPNALFWLRMGLYEDYNVGAAGPVSNHATAQTLIRSQSGIEDRVHFMQEGKGAADWRQDLKEWTEAAEGYNLPKEHPYEDRCRLTGFAVVLKREAVNRVMMEHKLLFDPLFSPAYFEDDDLGIRIARAGFRQVLCHNSIVWHAGGNGFQKGGNPVMESSRQKFMDKWGFDMWSYELPDEEIIARVEEKYPDHQLPLRILQKDCGMGVTLAALKYLYPNAYVAGTEQSSLLAGIGRYMADIRVEGSMKFYNNFSCLASVTILL